MIINLDLQFFTSRGFDSTSNSSISSSIASHTHKVRNLSKNNRRFFRLTSSPVNCWIPLRFRTNSFSGSSHPGVIQLLVFRFPIVIHTLIRMDFCCQVSPRGHPVLLQLFGWIPTGPTTAATATRLFLLLKQLGIDSSYLFV